jgi:N-6 DNA Methylase
MEPFWLPAKRGDLLMPPRAPGVHTHEEWKGMAQPVGLVVEPVVLNRLGIFPESATTVLADWQHRLEQLLDDQPVGEQWLSAAPSFEVFCQEVLAWQPGDLRQPEELAAPVAVTLDDVDEVLRPDWIVPEPNAGDGPLKAQLLVQELPLGTPFDALPKGADGRRGWEATPQQRLERLLKDSEHPIGLLWNGVALRLVYAPRGESSGHLTFPLEPMTTVDGRPMLAALQMLLGPDRLFEGGASSTRLRPLMEQSRKEQNEVSTRLAEQVLEALWILLRGFDAAGLQVDNPSHIYGGLITVLLRLVFLLYAEDEELMPSDSLYGQHYSVGGLAQRLRQDRADYQNAMDGRRGAWAALLSLFRLVVDGGGPSEAYLPARHGELFDPDAYPFLEGRPAGTSYRDGPLTAVPAMSDDVVEQVLTKLLLLDGQILSYRALDVEQIGSVYEGIMGFMVEQASGPSVGITHRPPRQKITITVVVEAEALLSQPAAKREKWLDDQAGVALKLPAKAKQGLKEAATLEELCLALGNRLSPHTPRGLAPGALILQPTAERRRSGSHYTPRALTEPIVAEAFRPWLERCHHKPSAEQILALKVCDPAMGSGAFLVAVCRYLAGWLVVAWERDGYPEAFRQGQDKDTVARRLVAQRCLYGVDKNPFAVNLAKLSLWLVTLSQDLPFTFVDHALKCGDSLVGYSVAEIRAAMAEVQLGFLDAQNRLYEQMGIERRESFGFDSLSDADYDSKKQRLEQQIQASEGLRQAGDLMVAAFFAKSKPKERADKQQVYLAMLSGTFTDDGLAETVQEIREQLAAGEKGITPFHWDLEFPEVFGDGRGGFDVFVGNPPFIGGKKIKEASGEIFQAWIRNIYPHSSANADLCTYFFLRASDLLCKSGTISLISTNTIYQGDTRSSGLTWLCGRGFSIYAATKRKAWPGVAAVVVSIVHMHKGEYQGNFILDDLVVPKISAYLLPRGPDKDPSKIPSSCGYSFVGGYTLGMGFTFSDINLLDEDEIGKPNSIKKMHQLLQADPANAEAIFPYLGGEEAVNHPEHLHNRYVINFGEKSLAECELQWPMLVAILRHKVKPEREKKAADVRRYPWWLHWRPRSELVYALSDVDTALVVNSGASPEFSIARVSARQVFAHSLNVFPETEGWMFPLLQSRVHELYARLVCSTMKDDLRYTHTTAMQTFPLPHCLRQLNPGEESIAIDRMVCAGNEYLEARQGFLSGYRIGLTDLYSRFNRPKYKDADLDGLRRLHGAMDAAVLKAFGWDDLIKPYGFDLAYFDVELEAPVLGDFECRINRQDFFFSTQEEACEFDSMISAAASKKKQLPWRLQWNKAVREELLVRLLTLNAEIIDAEGDSLGLQSVQPANNKVGGTSDDTKQLRLYV